MQRRVAAVYFVFFLVMGASAYSVIALADAPAVSVEGDTYEQGETLTVADRTYTVRSITAEEGEEGAPPTVTAELAWTNESATYTATLANNSTVPPTQVSWDGQAARYTTTLSEGDTVRFNGTETQVSIPDTESPSNFTLVAGGNATATIAVNDTLAYRGNTTTVTSVTADEVTLVWGEPYRVDVENASDPKSFTMVQQFNVSARLADDPAVENETITRDDGQRYVVYRSNGTTVRLDSYLPEADTASFEEGGALTVQDTEATIDNVSQSEVRLTWTAPRTNTVGIDEPGNVTLADQLFVATFPDGETLQLSEDVAGYQNELGRQDYFQERMNGLWGIIILSGLAAIFIIGLAYLPVKG
jgi:hypothetical protein